MGDDKRSTAREIARHHLEKGDPLGWFETLYVRADGDESIIPWADMEPNPSLVDWLNKTRIKGPGRALVIGCGLGDDAEIISGRGFATTAFDISVTAVDWARRRFPESSVSYRVADLFAPPAEWPGSFDFVLESYTLQVLPPSLRAEAIRRISCFPAPAGTLLVLARGRSEKESPGTMPWPLCADELGRFREHGLQQISFEDFLDDEDPPVRRFRVQFVKS